MQSPAPRGSLLVSARDAVKGLGGHQLAVEIGSCEHLQGAGTHLYFVSGARGVRTLQYRRLLRQQS